MKKKLFPLFYFLFLSLLLGQSISFNKEFQVNTTAYGWQYGPSVCALVNGNFVISWVSEPGDGSGSGIFAQIFSAEGIKIGTEVLVNTDTIDYQRSPSVCALSDGGFVICWTSSLLDGSSHVSMQIYNEDGTKFGPELRLSTNNEEYQSSAKVCGIKNGGFIICWESVRRDGNGSGIFAQILTNEGFKVGDEITVSGNTYDQNLGPTLTTLSNGDIVICWRSYNITDSGQGIFAQILNENGIKIGSELKVNTLADGFLKHPKISAVSNDRFLVTWTYHPYEGNNGAEILVQLFNNGGLKVGEEFQANTFMEDFQELSTVSNLLNGSFIISWQSKYQDGDLTGIFSQIFDEQANKIGSEFQVNDFTKRFQSGVSSSSFGNGKFIICWTSEGDQDGSGAGVFGKIYPNEPSHHQLKDFELVEPNDKQTIETNSVNFIWNSATRSKYIFSWELTYDLCIDNDESFSNPLIISGIEDTTYQVDSLQHGQTYHWKLLARNYFGDSLWSSNVNVFYVEPNATGVEEITFLIKNKFELTQNYPNPFNPSTVINYSIPNETHPFIPSREGKERSDRGVLVTIKVYDVLGKEVSTLVNETKQPGNYNVEFNATNLPSGIYFYRLQVDEFSDTKKMVLIR